MAWAPCQGVSDRLRKPQRERKRCKNRFPSFTPLFASQVFFFFVLSYFRVFVILLSPSLEKTLVSDASQKRQSRTTLRRSVANRRTASFLMRDSVFRTSIAPTEMHVSALVRTDEGGRLVADSDCRPSAVENLNAVPPIAPLPNHAPRYAAAGSRSRRPALACRRLAAVPRSQLLRSHCLAGAGRTPMCSGKRPCLPAILHLSWRAIASI
jgi:hypothetical protein